MSSQEQDLLGRSMYPFSSRPSSNNSEHLQRKRMKFTADLFLKANHTCPYGGFTSALSSMPFEVLFNFLVTWCLSILQTPPNRWAFSHATNYKKEFQFSPCFWQKKNSKKKCTLFFFLECCSFLHFTTIVTQKTLLPHPPRYYKSINCIQTAALYSYCTVTCTE